MRRGRQVIVLAVDNAAQHVYGVVGFRLKRAAVSTHINGETPTYAASRFARELAA